MQHKGGAFHILQMQDHRQGMHLWQAPNFPAPALQMLRKVQMDNKEFEEARWGAGTKRGFSSSPLEIHCTDY